MTRILASAGAEARIAVRNRWVGIAIASLTSLAVYLVPLIALLMSFVAIAGEVERGTLPLIPIHPIRRGEIRLGKFIAHLMILSLAVTVDYGPAAGAAFPAIGDALWALARRPGAAAGPVIGLWLIMIVLYDFSLLAAIVADDGGCFTTDVFPCLLIANPADAFRLYNLAAAAGLGGAAATIAPTQALMSILLWPMAAFALAVLAF